jgi:hypothetical protein
MNVLVLGFELTARSGWQEYLDAPEKPSNWKEETFQAKLPELWAKKEKEAPEHLAAGKIKAICGLGEQLLYEQFTPAGLIANVEGWLKASNPFTLVGFDLADGLRHVAWDYLHAEKAPSVPWWLWPVQDMPQLIKVDPFSLSGAKQERIKLRTWLAHWGIDLPDPATAAASALAAAQAFHKMGGPDVIKG